MERCTYRNTDNQDTGTNPSYRRMPDAGNFRFPPASVTKSPRQEQRRRREQTPSLESDNRIITQAIYGMLGSGIHHAVANQADERDNPTQSEWDGNFQFAAPWWHKLEREQPDVYARMTTSLQSHAHHMVDSFGRGVTVMAGDAWAKIFDRNERLYYKLTYGINGVAQQVLHHIEPEDEGRIRKFERAFTINPAQTAQYQDQLKDRMRKLQEAYDRNPDEAELLQAELYDAMSADVLSLRDMMPGPHMIRLLRQDIRANAILEGVDLNENAIRRDPHTGEEYYDEEILEQPWDLFAEEKIGQLANEYDFMINVMSFTPDPATQEEGAVIRNPSARFDIWDVVFDPAKDPEGKVAALLQKMKRVNLSFCNLKGWHEQGKLDLYIQFLDALKTGDADMYIRFKDIKNHVAVNSPLHEKNRFRRRMAYESTHGAIAMLEAFGRLDPTFLDQDFLHENNIIVADILEVNYPIVERWERNRKSIQLKEPPNLVRGTIDQVQDTGVEVEEYSFNMWEMVNLMPARLRVIARKAAKAVANDPELNAMRAEYEAFEQQRYAAA